MYLGNEMVPNLEYPQPVYTSPIGTATTVTVQAFPISEAIIGVSKAVNKLLFNVYIYLYYLIYLSTKLLLLKQLIRLVRITMNQWRH